MLLEKKLAKFGIKPGLERIQNVCAALGNPQEKMKVILVTGTNGKGSTTSYLASILNEARYKVGSFYSPHVFRYNERFKVNGKEISDALLKKYEKKLLALHRAGYEMTLFEALTAIAYLYFADSGCDYAVMEIGMGGRLDATNVANEAISIITTIDLDHTEYLGRTPEGIARDKAGIIKTGMCITGAEKGALAVIDAVGAEKNKQVRALERDFFAQGIETTAQETRFNYLGYAYYKDLNTSLLGEYQARNAALSVAAAEELGLEENAIREGLKKALNPCRLQLVSRRPAVLVDAAHNPHGIGSLISNLHLFNFNRIICIFGCLKTKNWQEMLMLLAPHCDKLIITEIPKNENSAPAQELAAFARSLVLVSAVPDVQMAVAAAKKEVKKGDIILICGSIYLLSDAVKAVKKK